MSTPAERLAADWKDARSDRHSRLWGGCQGEDADVIEKAMFARVRAGFPRLPSYASDAVAVEWWRGMWVGAVSAMREAGVEADEAQIFECLEQAAWDLEMAEDYEVEKDLHERGYRSDEDWQRYRAYPEYEDIKWPHDRVYSPVRSRPRGHAPRVRSNHRRRGSHRAGAGSRAGPDDPDGDDEPPGQLGAPAHLEADSGVRAMSARTAAQRGTSAGFTLTPLHEVRRRTVPWLWRGWIPANGVTTPPRP